MSDLSIEYVEVSALTPDPRNARKHGEKNLEAIKSSLREFGQRRPLVVTSDYIVVAGNGTLEAAKALGWKQVAVTVFPYDDPEKVRAFALADNRTAELAEWDSEVLFETLVDLSAAGWDVKDLGFDPVKTERGSEKAPDEFPEYDDNIPTEFCCPKCGYEWSGSAR